MKKRRAKTFRFPKRSRPIAATRRTPPGSPPGTLVADPHAAAPTIHCYAFGPGRLDELDAIDPGRVRDVHGQYPVVWVDIVGLGDAQVIEEIGRIFGIHSLALEDVLNVHQRAKTEEYEDLTFAVIREPVGEAVFETEQLSIFVGKDFVVTFRERPGQSLDPVRTRLRREGSLLRARGADYLAYALIDAVIDSYFPIIEELGEQIEAIEDAMAIRSDETLLPTVHRLRRELIEMRRAVWPLRDMTHSLSANPSSAFGDETAFYLRDCYDHTIQLIDLIESYRDQMSILIELHLSAVNMRMNEIMKVLTIIATIFMPLGFIASVFGMNFDRGRSPWNMPELGWYLGYPFALGIMGVVALGMVFFFWSKGWIGWHKGGG
ncbi:MAG: magnesium transporter [Paracoccaceae bacterium]|jgi:magnesium transporter